MQAGLSASLPLVDNQQFRTNRKPPVGQGTRPVISINSYSFRRKGNHLLFRYSKAGHLRCLECPEVTRFPKVVKHVLVEGNGSSVIREKSIPQC